MVAMVTLAVWLLLLVAVKIFVVVTLLVERKESAAGADSPRSLRSD